MPDAFWSIDDYINWRCDPDEDPTGALAELHAQLASTKIEVSGWKCSWHPYGKDRRTGGVREIVPSLAIVDLKFESVPDDSDIVLISQSRSFYEEPLGGLVLQLNERSEWGPRIEGWGELRLRADGARAIRRFPSKQKRPAAATPRPKIQAWLKSEIDPRAAQGERWSQAAAWDAARKPNIFGGSVRKQTVIDFYQTLRPDWWKPGRPPRAKIPPK